MEPLTVTRRDVLRAASALGLSFVLPALDLRGANRRGPERPKSLITLWLAGGPSQFETWDPHPGTKNGGPTRAIPTRTRGLEIAEYYPRLAEEIDALSVLRSLVSKEGDHGRGTYFVKTGYRPDPTLIHPAVGAIVAHERPNPALHVPQYISLVNSEWPGRGGFLGDKFDAFRVADPGGDMRNLRAAVQGERQQRRLANLGVLSDTFRRGRPAAADTLHRETVERALRMMNSDQLRAFEFADEPRQVRESYGNTPFGRGCLVARRLVETGVRSIEVTLGGFDSHANNLEAHQRNAAILDPAFAALIRDLRERDLLESTVVLCIGEFGRTPTINPLDGRDHWPHGFSCVVGGGGLRNGLLLGATDPEGTRQEPEDPIDVQDLYATILHVLGIEHDRELMTPVGRPMRLTEGTPLQRLLS